MVLAAVFALPLLVVEGWVELAALLGSIIVGGTEEVVDKVPTELAATPLLFVPPLAHNPLNQLCSNAWSEGLVQTASQGPEVLLYQAFRGPYWQKHCTCWADVGYCVAAEHCCSATIMFVHWRPQAGKAGVATGGILSWAEARVMKAERLLSMRMLMADRGMVQNSRSTVENPRLWCNEGLFVELGDCRSVAKGETTVAMIASESLHSWC